MSLLVVKWQHVSSQAQRKKKQNAKCDPGKIQSAVCNDSSLTNTKWLKTKVGKQRKAA